MIFRVLFVVLGCFAISACNSTRPTEALLPVAPLGWEQTPPAAFEDKSTAVWWRKSNIVVSLTRADLKPLARGTDHPTFRLAVTDDVGGTVFDPSLVRFVEPCEPDILKNVSLDDLVEIQPSVIRSNLPESYQYTHLTKLSRYELGPMERVSARIAFKVDPEIIEKCTIRVQDAVRPVSGESIPDVTFIRDVYQKFGR